MSKQKETLTKEAELLLADIKTLMGTLSSSNPIFDDLTDDEATIYLDIITTYGGDPSLIPEAVRRMDALQESIQARKNGQPPKAQEAGDDAPKKS